MLRRLALIPLMLLLGCRDSQPVAPPSKETPAVHPNARIRAEMRDFMAASLKNVDVDALNASDNKRLATFAFAFGAITRRVQDEGLHPVDAHALALILYTEFFEMSDTDSAKVAQTMIDRTADRTWAAIMEDGGRDVAEWVKDGQKQSPKGLARLLGGVIPDLKGTATGVAKIIVTHDGAIYLDGQQVTLEQLDAEIASRLPEVWYHREHPEDENPHENATKVLDIVVKHRRPIALFLDSNFTTRAKLQ
jgi:hypothetical protein